MALIVIALGGFTGAVYVDTHAVDDDVHDTGLNVPPAPLSLHDTVPERAVGELDVSLAWAENVNVSLEGRVAELGVIVTLVGLS